MDNQYTIFCVEDEADIRAELIFALKKYRFNVLSASSGEEALNSLRTIHPDLILCDILMPGFGGLELLKRVREQLAHLASTPFLFLSALGDRTHILDGLKLGADDYLTKPIDFEVLEAKIMRNLNLVERARNAPKKLVVAPSLKLTKREVEVLSQFALGHTNAKVAENLGLSEYTVGDHAKSIFRKLEVTTRTQAVHAAMSYGYISVNYGRKNTSKISNS
ncbi:response regulator transcription factor [Brucella sp. NBRC 12950]|uniref:response regulator transcription factor n=1 Tax=Brucella sp. NBRC 12950 TaxID=2994518 RepID=UPI0024A322EE|nr:response regulator transcription factor [Brucella sp. NBRC 12950]GLU29713.1 DNA-binding response regulator [Brucella sp. NBRC 12950]